MYKAERLFDLHLLDNDLHFLDNQRSVKELTLLSQFAPLTSGITTSIWRKRGTWHRNQNHPLLGRWKNTRRPLADGISSQVGSHLSPGPPFAGFTILRMPLSGRWRLPR